MPSLVNIKPSLKTGFSQCAGWNRSARPRASPGPHEFTEVMKWLLPDAS